jgi:hypothetical protein
LVEQQSEARLQASPSVRQAVVPPGAGRAWQVVLQEPVQHCAAEVQAVPVAAQAVASQKPPVQETEQHSPALRQAAPGVLQNAVEEQVCVAALQEEEQQSPLVAQAAPASLQAETGGAQVKVEGLQ